MKLFFKLFFKLYLHNLCKMKFKLPKNIISNNVLKNMLYLVSLALAVSYIMNEQSLALVSLILIACVIYVMNKSIVIALLISIIVTNFLLSINYLKEGLNIEAEINTEETEVRGGKIQGRSGIITEEQGTQQS